MTEIYNPLEEEKEENKLEDIKIKKSSGSGIWFSVAILAGVALVSGMVVTAYFLNVQPKSQETAFSHNPVVAQLKSQSILFCNNFFNLSYTTYKDARRRSEEFMTPNLLSQYKEIFYETQFTDDVTGSGLATDYIYNQVLEGVYNGQAAIKVIGYIKYTSVKKNVSVEMPITTVLVWAKDGNGTWKIDNLLLEM